jgi:hypothetical protein
MMRWVSMGLGCLSVASFFPLRRPFLALVVALPLLLNAANAQGQPAPPAEEDPEQRPLVLEGHLGLGSPYGFVGAAADYRVVRHLSLNLGGGLGGSGPLGAGMARLRLPFGHYAASLEGGVSIGRAERSDKDGLMAEETKATYVWSPAVWGHVGVGFEGRDGAFQWRVSVGYAQVLNADSFSCSSSSNRCGSDSAPSHLWQIPYAGLALGYALPL